jgi:hypothetical protein
MKSLISHSIDDYEALLDRLLRDLPFDHAKARAVR